MLIIHELFWRIYDLLGSMLDTENTEVGKTDVFLALMELTMGDMNNNPKKPDWVPQVGDSEITVKICIVTTPCGKVQKEAGWGKFGVVTQYQHINKGLNHPDEEVWLLTPTQLS